MNPPKMPVHIGDFLRDTGHLRAAGTGAYLLLLFHHWSTGSLPDDDEQLSAIAKMTPAEWRKAKPIIERFFQAGWRHGRVEKDLEAARESYEKRAKAGAEGGKAKAKSKQSSSNATAGLQQPLTFNQGTKEEETSSLRSEADSAPGASAKRSRARAKTSLPDDWKPDQQDVDYSRGRGFTQLLIPLMANAFSNHHRAKATLSADWHASWRTWTENEIKFHGGPNGQRTGATARQPAGADFLAGMRSVAEDLVGDADPARREASEVPLGRFNIDG